MTAASHPGATAAASVAALQADALIEQIERQVAAQRQALLEAAAAEADDIRGRARAKARARLRRAIADLRGTERQRLQQAQAEIETAQRQQASKRAQQALALAWPTLAPALAQRWRDDPARAAWVAALLALARERLPAAGWRLRHPAAWGEAEIGALRTALATLGATETRLHADPDCSVGLVIEVGGARLDGRPAALLADRPQVEATLLALLEPAPAEGGAR